MAVYTKISKKDIFFINKKFDIENLKNFKRFKKIIKKTNYFLN